MKEVTDPKLLAQLNASLAPPKPKTKPAARPVTAERRRIAFDALKAAQAEFERGFPSMTPAQRKKAMTLFLANPKIKQLRMEADLVPLADKEQEIKRVARRRVAQEAPKPAKPNTLSRAISMLPGGRLTQFILGTEQGQALQAGAEKGAFNLPVRARSAVNYLGGLLSGNGRSYEDEFAISTEENRIKRDKAPITAFAGELLGAVGSGGGAGGLVRAGGTALAKVAPRAGNAIAGLTRLEQGKHVANIGKAVTAGAAGGAAQALGEGEDVSTGATIGAIAGPAALGGIKLTEWLSRPVRDFFRVSTSGDILRRFTNDTPEAIAARADDFRQRSGTEPTLFEVLNGEDRQNIVGLVKRLPGSSRERATEKVQARVAAMPRELTEGVERVTAGQQRFMARSIALDLAAARGAAGKPTREEIALAQRAVRDPTEMEMVRRTTTRSIMQPFDDRQAYETLDELMPTEQVLEGSTVVDKISDPEVASFIRSAAGVRRMSPDGLTIRDVSDIISDLRNTVGKGGIEGNTAQRAVNHLEDLMQRDHPDAAEAMLRMRESFAGRSRMMEGISEGRRTRLRENVPVTDAGKALNVRNVYDTSEGAAGRTIGQRSEILDAFGGTPNQAVARAGEIADSPLMQEAINRNLGSEAGQQISQISAAQAESLRRLGALRRGVQGENNEADAGDIVMTTALLSPTSLIRTKAQALESIMRVLSGIPEGRANALVDMLFSQDAAMTQKGLSLLRSAGERGRLAAQDAAIAIASGAQAQSGYAALENRNTAITQQIQATEKPIVEESVSEPGEVTDPELLAALNATINTEQPQYEHYGRAVIEGLFPEAVITEDFRDASSKLGRANPDSHHIHGDGAVDIRPIPGMTFDQFIQQIEDAGYHIIEAMDETESNKSGHATGNHWHVVFE
jgi:hypothetical protein